MAEEYRQNSLKPYESPSLEIEKNAKSGGNTGLPFGLCKNMVLIYQKGLHQEMLGTP